MSCVFMFVYNGLNTLCGIFILHLLRKARGCCMHVFSSYELRSNGFYDHYLCKTEYFFKSFYRNVSLEVIVSSLYLLL